MKNIPSKVFVLCPGNPRIEDGKIILQESDEYGYLGSSIRLDAAVQLCYNKDITHLFLLGGSESKVKAMQFYILQQLKSNADLPEIVLLISEPNTSGNLKAINKVLQESKCSHDKIGILSNFYHQPRIMTLASEIIKNVRVIPIVAESLVHSSPSIEMNIHMNRELMKRIKNEIQGITDFQDVDN